MSNSPFDPRTLPVPGDPSPVRTFFEFLQLRPVIGHHRVWLMGICPVGANGYNWCILCSQLGWNSQQAGESDFSLANGGKCDKRDAALVSFSSTYAYQKPNSRVRRNARQSRRLGPRGKKPSQHDPRRDGLAQILVRSFRAGRTGNRCLRRCLRSVVSQRFEEVHSLRFGFNNTLIPTGSFPHTGSCLCSL